MSVGKNAIAERLLRRAGFQLEQEPPWVTTGEVPDFFCVGPAELWVEVKAVAEPKHFKRMGKQWKWLRDRAASVREHGSATVWVSPDATEQHIKAAFALTRDGLRLWASDPSRADRVFVIVPSDPNFSQRVYLTLVTPRRTELLVCVESRSGRYGRPPIDLDITWSSQEVLVEKGGERQTVHAFALGLHDDNFLVALELERSDTPFKIGAMLPPGPARKITTMRTVRLAAKKANAQFKNACQYRSVSCLLFVFEDGALVQEPRAFAAAFYGDISYVFDPRDFRNGQWVFGRDGFWSPVANRTTSGACLVRNNGDPVLLRNIWASVPLAADVFGWSEIVIHPDGTVRFPA